MFGSIWPDLAQVCFGASVPNAIIKPERKLCGITCVSSVLPVLSVVEGVTGFKKRNALNLRKQY